MIITCPACDARYRAAPTEIPASGRAVRCSACGAEWSFRPEPEARPAPESAPQPDPAPLAAPARRAPPPAATRPEPRRARKGGGGFMAGFAIMALLIALGVGVYVKRDAVVAAAPQAAPVVANYVALVNRGRAALDDLIDKARSAME